MYDVRDKYFPFGEQEITWLKSRDPQLGAFISEMGKPKRKLLPDLFSGLVFYIISQQISAKAAFISEITKLPGIGEWTAQMLLIHVLKRPDVISFKDLAVLRGMRMVYQIPVVLLHMQHGNE